MSVTTFRAGSIKTYTWKKDNSKALGSLTSIVPLACAIAFNSDTLNLGNRSKLDTTATYQFLLGLQGNGLTVKGYTIAGASQGSGIASVSNSTTQGILLTVAASAWGGVTNAAYAQGVQVWVKKNSGNYQLHSVVPLNSSNTWQTVIFTEPTINAVTADITTLQSTTATDSNIKSRDPVGGTFELTGVTEDGVTIEDTTEQINYRPDTSTNYAYAITRGLKVTFKTLNNSMRDFVRARAGEYVKWTDGGIEYQQANKVFQSASAIASENQPLRLIFPVDENNAVEDAWFYASVTQNQTGGSANWGKQDPPTTDWTFETVNNDSLLQEVPAYVGVIRRVL